MFQRRVVGLVLAAFAAGLMGFSLLSHRWWGMKEDDESVSFGLRSVEMCREDSDGGRSREECRTQSLGKLFRGDEDDDRDRDEYSDYDDYDRDERKSEPGSFLMLGNLTFFGGIAAGVLLVICGGAVLMNQHARASKGLGTATAVASGAYTGAALLFVLMAPDQLKDVPYGMALPLSLIAGACGIGAGIVLGRFDPAFEMRPIPIAHQLSGLAPSKVPSLVLSGIGIVLVLASIWTNTWWSRSEDEYKMSLGVREVESCYQDRYGSYGDYGDSDRVREKCSVETLRIRESSGDYDDEDDRESGQKTFIRAGAIAYHTGLMACVLTLLAGTLMLAGARTPGQLTPANITIAFAGLFLLGSLVFLASKPSQLKELNASFGPFLALAGGGCLVGAGIAIGRFMPQGMTAQAQPWAAGPMAMPMGMGPMGPMGPMTPPGPMGIPLAQPMTPMTPIPGSIPAVPFGDVRSGPVTPACPQCAAPMVFATQHGRWFCAACRVYA